MKVKSGIKTSEFPLALIVSTIGMVMANSGWINPSDVDPITEAVTIIVGAVMTIITSAVYIWSRVRVKTGTKAVG